MGTVEFYFDFSSPNAYFSSVQLDRLSEGNNDVSVEWMPVFLGGIMNELETTPPAMQNQLKADYLMTDLQRWGEEYDIPFDFPEDFPINSLPALRSYLVLEECYPDQAVPFAREVFRGCWANGRDIEKLDVIRDLLPETLKGQLELQDSISEKSVKDDLRRQTDEAIERGVFGCPTFFVDGEMFWGKDRLDFVRRRLGVNAQDS